MKKKYLEKLLKRNGWVKVDGTKHDRWIKAENTEFVPRHTEVNEILAKEIIKKWGLK